MAKRRCQWLDEEDNRCGRTTTQQTYIFENARLSYAGWFVVYLCDLHRDKRIRREG